MARLIPIREVMLLTLILAALSCVGCNKAKNPWELVYPAKGVVLVNGKPISGAQITLVPQDTAVPNSVRPSATTNENGEFVLGTYSRKDGAPAGRYKAVVLHYPVVGTKESPAPGRNDLPSKYARPESTDLILVVEKPKSEGLSLELRK